MFSFHHYYKIEQRVPLQPYYHVLTSEFVAPLVVVILARVSRISHRLLSPFLELCRTVSTDLSLTWTTLSDHFRVPYHHTYTLILTPFHWKRQVTLSSHFQSYTVVFVVWLFWPYSHRSRITASCSVNGGTPECWIVTALSGSRLCTIFDQ